MKQTFKKPSYYLLSQAMDGDEKAIEKILAFYDPYISKCCLRPLYDEYGNIYFQAFTVRTWRKRLSNLNTFLTPHIYWGIHITICVNYNQHNRSAAQKNPVNKICLLLVFSVPTERAAIATGNDLRGLGICHQQALAGIPETGFLLNTQSYVRLHCLPVVYQ